MGLFSQTEVELSRFGQNTKFHLFFNLLPLPSLAITICISQASGLERASTGAGHGQPWLSTSEEGEGSSSVSDIRIPGCIGVDLSV